MMEKNKVLISPAHYFLDDKTGGSEIYWIVNILKGIAKSKIYSLDIITGYIKNIEIPGDEHNIFEISKTFKNHLNVFYALYFTLKKSFLYRRLRLKNDYRIIHHMLPFGIGSTFDLDFIFKDKNKKYILGPIQAPPTPLFSDEEFDYVTMGFNISILQKLMRKTDVLLIALFKKVTNYLNNLTIEKADKIVVINEHAKKLILNRKVSEEKILIIPPGIDTNKFEYIPFERKELDIFELITVGSLIKRKGIDFIIRAIAEIVGCMGNVKLRIVGDGPQRESLGRLVEELCLSDFIIFQGHVSHNEMYKYYQKAHIFVSMSQSETWGQMYLEAMACGLPVIASRNIGSNEIIKEGIFGYLIEQKNYQKLSEVLISLLKNKERIAEFGKNACLEIKKHYDWQTSIIPQYLKMYGELLIDGTEKV